MPVNRIQRAEYLIYSYVTEFFVQLRVLVDPELDVALNEPAHGLSREEVVVLLHHMFESHKLVASRDTARGLFTPTLEEIEAALNEDPDSCEHETHYGLTTVGLERMRELKDKGAGT